MILIGQFDSPFVRRVGVTLTLYGMAFEHRPWSVWADAEALSRVNPLRRVPTLVLDDGETLIESGAILDALDEMAGAERAMLPRSGPARRRALRICALGSGLADKGVSLFYEGVLHAAPSTVWVARCEAQISAVLGALEAERASARGDWWLGDAIGHADIMAACALGFVREAHARPSTPPAGRSWRPIAPAARRCPLSRPSASRSRSPWPPRLDPGCGRGASGFLRAPAARKLA